jgi:acetyl esterase/lipase
VDAAVAISVNQPYVLRLAGGRTVTPRSVLLLACDGDPGRSESAHKLLAASSDPRKMLLFPGGAHNLAVLREHPEAKRATFAWLAERLGLPPPAPEPALPPAK